MDGFNMTRAFDNSAAFSFADRFAALAGTSTPSAMAAPRQRISAETGGP
jgi:hypothetical protein